MVKEKTKSGISYYNFGSNNYSCGMEAVIFNPDDITPAQVHFLDGFYLHPTEEPNSLEIFALKGTESEYADFTDTCKRHVAYKAMLDSFGWPDTWTEETSKAAHELKDKIIAEFKPWFHKLIEDMPVEGDYFNGDPVTE